MANDVVPLPRARLGQTMAAAKTEAINARACTYCEAPRGCPCRRPGLDGRLYELTFLHTCRLHDPRPEEDADA